MTALGGPALGARRAPRWLLSAPASAALATVVVAAGVALWSLASEREAQARSAIPSALSLVYLNLALLKRPEDQELRLELARDTLRAGHHRRARELV